MQILDLSDLSDGSPFCIRRILVDGKRYFAEIQPIQSRFKIQISKGDYKTILDAYQSRRIVKIYPFEGKVNKDHEFTEGDYKIEII